MVSCIDGAVEGPRPIRKEHTPVPKSGAYVLIGGWARIWNGEYGGVCDVEFARGGVRRSIELDHAVDDTDDSLDLEKE